ncbi:MAG: Type 1 glutamine amidotransferase-like domain-containing protein, partial [Nocardioidaceae bacterium]
MRLYLSSFRNGDHTQRLLDLRRTDRPVAVIANAVDDAAADIRREAFTGERERLSAIGLTCEELDLRDFEGDEVGLEATLRAFEIAWLRGGNVFALRYAMSLCGADRIFPLLLAEDVFVYAGYSAGACCLAPSLRGLEACDDVGVVERLYGAEPIWDGLGIIDEAFVPHLDSPGHPETDLLARVAAAYERDGVPHLRLRDGDVYV